VNETASGWQQVLFGAPVAVTAGTTYVASYHAPSGGYSSTLNTFAPAPALALLDGDTTYMGTTLLPGDVLHFTVQASNTGDPGNTTLTLGSAPRRRSQAAASLPTTHGLH